MDGFCTMQMNSDTLVVNCSDRAEVTLSGVVVSLLSDVQRLYSAHPVDNIDNCGWIRNVITQPLLRSWALSSMGDCDYDER